MKDFLFNEESGQGMVEYGLILALVAVVAITILASVGGKVKNTFKTVDTEMSKAAPAEG